MAVDGAAVRGRGGKPADGHAWLRVFAQLGADPAAPAPTEQSRQDYIARNIPAGRFGEPQDAAALIAFLASGQAGYITGATIPVDGGALRYAF